MPGWKFWEKPDTERETPPAPAPAGRFNVRPRTDLVGGALPTDHVEASRVGALRKRRDGVLFDVEQATLAGESTNPWLERIATIDEAARAVEADLTRIAKAELVTPGVELSITPVEIVQAVDDPAPRVEILVGDVELIYVEDLDWAERGTQIARTELHLESGDIGRLVPADVIGSDRDELRDVLGDSLFSIATAAPDQPLWPVHPLRNLARPDAEFGGWVDISGNSPRRRARVVRTGELTAELERLRAERDKELEEMARWRERLPIAQRRLRDVDEQIAAALATGTS